VFILNKLRLHLDTSKQDVFIFHICAVQGEKIVDMLKQKDASLSYVGYYNKRTKEFVRKRIIFNVRSQQRSIIFQVRTQEGALIFDIRAEQRAIIFEL
jgi:hypothetical protein